MTPDHAPAAAPWAAALAKALGGGLLGLLTALILVGASYSVWPGLKEDGQDAGLRLAVWLDSIKRESGFAPLIRGTADAPARYLLLDLDTGQAASDYCATLRAVSVASADCEPGARIARSLLAKKSSPARTR